MKYIRATFLTLFVSLFFFILPISAQDDVNPAGISGKGPSFACLDLSWCIEDGICSIKSKHRVKLTTSTQKGAPNSDAYVAECFDSVPGYGTLCTTGNSDLDKELFCTEEQIANGDPVCDRFNILKETIHYSITTNQKGEAIDSYGWFWQENGQMVKKTPPEKLRTNGLGNLIPSVLEVQSSTPEKLMRRYVLFTVGQDSSGANTGIGGQQQDILSFEQRSTSCVGESWDPEGRVFDAVSLEPIPKVNVTVQELREGGK